MLQDNITLKIDSNEDGIILQFLITQYQPSQSSHVTARDSDILDDYAEIVFDFTGEGKAAYGFRVSASGSTNDFSLDNKNRKFDSDTTMPDGA